MHSKFYSVVFGLCVSLISTSASAQCNPPTSFSATVSSQGVSATLSWSPVIGSSSYEVFWAAKPANLPPTSGTSVMSSSYFYVGPLTPHTTYDVCIRSVCSGIYFSPWYCDTFRTTATQPCLPPTQFLATATGPNSASLSWVASASAYKYEYITTPWPGMPTASPQFWAYNSPCGIGVTGSPGIHNVHMRSVCSFATTPYSVWVTDSVHTPFPASVASIQDVELTTYPNPTTDKFYIEAGTTTVSEIQLADIYGRVLLRSSLQVKERKEIDLTPYARGLYILNYETSAGTLSRKIQKL